MTSLAGSAVGVGSCERILTVDRSGTPIRAASRAALFVKRGRGARSPGRTPASARGVKELVPWPVAEPLGPLFAARPRAPSEAGDRFVSARVDGAGASGDDTDGAGDTDGGGNTEGGGDTAAGGGTVGKGGIGSGSGGAGAGGAAGGRGEVARGGSRESGST
jgi:hypothetical protein